MQGPRLERELEPPLEVRPPGPVLPRGQQEAQRAEGLEQRQEGLEQRQEGLEQRQEGVLLAQLRGPQEAQVSSLELALREAHQPPGRQLAGDHRAAGANRPRT